jgi:hypothetical protein
VPGREHHAERRQADGSGDEVVATPEGHVHRPVVTTGLAVLPGAVERIDDPHAVVVEAPGILEAFLGQHRVVGPEPTQLVLQIPLARGVAAVHHLPRVRAPCPQLLAQSDEALAGLDGEPDGERCVGLGRGHGRGHAPISPRASCT